MSRPVKKPNGKQISAYVRKEVYASVVEAKPSNQSLSDFVEEALLFYAEHKDIISEFKQLRDKYIELEAKCQTPNGNVFLSDLKKHAKEGVTWAQTMKSMGITEPKEIVQMLNKYTFYAPNSRRVRIIRGLDGWVLVDFDKSKSDIYFVMHKPA